MKKLLIFINCFVLLFTTLFVPVLSADTTEAQTGQVQAADTSGAYYDVKPPKYATQIMLLVNADTDTVIYSKNADKITAPASLTKLITAMVVLSECKDLSTVITCSYDAIHSLDGTGSSVAGLMADEKVSVEMLLYCLFLPSANDAAAVLAEHFGGEGKEPAFVEKMNALAKKLGCKDTHFANPHGLDDETKPLNDFSSDTQNRTTASDMYRIAKEALQNPTIRKLSSKYGKTMPATNKSEERYLYNTNALLNSYSDYYYADAVGLKTGTTDKAGSCLITSASKNGYTYIAICMKGVSDYPLNGKTYNSAFLMCRYLLQWAFDNMALKVIAEKSSNLGEVAVEFGRGSDYVALCPASTVCAVVYADAQLEDMQIVLADDFPKEIPSPVKAGDKVGKCKLMYGEITVAEVELVALNDVGRNHLWALFSIAEKIVTSKAFWIAVIVALVLLLAVFGGTKKKREQKRRKKYTVEVVKDYSRLSDD